MTAPGADASVLLEATVADEDLRKLLAVCIDTCADIAHELQRTLVRKVGTQNSFGDEQLTVDMVADQLLFKRLEESKLVVAAASEEAVDLKELGGSRFIVNFDPLDGSSIVDCNWAVGTIIGIFDAATLKDKSLIGATGRQQVGSMMAVYGPRTTLLIALSDGVYELFLQDPGAKKWVVSAARMTIGEVAKIFAPANLRAAQDLPGYRAQIDDWMARKLTLRYTGGLVPDVGQIFVKQQGVFANPCSAKAPAKLRLVFECAPIALLVETAGGASHSGQGSTLDVPIENMDQRVPFCAGSKTDVANFPKLLE